MKRYIKFSVVKVIVFLCFIVLSLACATTSVEAPEFTVSYEYESESPSVTISVAPYWNSFKGGIDGFSCNFINNTNEIIKIVWENSFLCYEGNSYISFIEGQKYIDKNKPMPAALIPRKGSLGKGVYSSDQVYYVSGKYGGWRMSAIMDNSIQIIFQVETDKGKEYVTVNVSYQKEEE